MTVRKIIIDTDPGIDDAMAIFLALASPELKVVGLTTVMGNVEVDLATTNALRLLEIASRQDIPVAEGAAKPIAADFLGAVAFVHGDDGQGNAFLPPPTRQPLDISAAEFIVQQARAYPGEITLVPIGPLTNIALALRLEPNLPKLVAGVVLMGGNAFCPGNASPVAEANIRNDAEAADVVFGAGWPITMVGLDVTNEVLMTDRDLNELHSFATPAGQHMARINPFYRAFLGERLGTEGIVIHDSTAIAYLLAPDLFEVVKAPVRVETGGLFSRGKTWPYVGRTDDNHLPAWQSRPLVDICTAVNGPAVVALILNRLRP
jgi:purine nucleosidase